MVEEKVVISTISNHVEEGRAKQESKDENIRKEASAVQKQEK